MRKKESETVVKEEVLYHHIKSKFIEEQVKLDLEEKTRYAKEIIKLCKFSGFEDETITKLFNMVYNMESQRSRASRVNKYNKRYMLGVIDIWDNNNIKTPKDVKEFYQALENEIVNITNRDLTTYEKLEIERLIYYYKVDKNKIVSKIKEKGQLDINELEKEFIKTKMLEN